MSVLQEATDETWRWKGDKDPRWVGEWRTAKGERIHGSMDWVLAHHAMLERTRKPPVFWDLLSKSVRRKFQPVRRRLP